ncbi:HAMP domain-containing sensor histidine kinase [Parafrigoribacterium mesophilum]|uniref:sensor histidine kinase n=1 Tax=Parafrigoribacterium mesophilum TaxID=433646 RepID=UPI0031FD7755
MHDQATQWWSGVSLRTKITGVTVLLLTIGLLVAGVGTMTVLRGYLLDEVDRKISEAALNFGNIPPMGETLCERSAGPGSLFVAVLDEDGDLVCRNRAADSAQPVLGGLSLPTVTKLEHEPFTRWDRTRTTQWRVVAVPYSMDGTSTFVSVVVAVNLTDTNSIIGRYVAIFLGFGLSVVILGAALTRLLVTSTFVPLREVERMAAAIADGDFSKRLPGATPNTEVGRLNRSMNTMLGRIDRAFADRARTIDQMRRFVGDASHELRTPLVSVRGYAELYRMGALQKPEDVAQAMDRIEKEAIRMGALVEDLLELARIDEARPLQLRPVDLVPIARDAALDAMASSPDRVVSVVVVEPHPQPDHAGEAPPPPPQPAGAHPLTAPTGPIAFAGATLARLRSRRARSVKVVDTIDMPQGPALTVPAVVLAEENKIRQVVTNLMGNAMRFTADDSPIELAIEVDAARRVAMLDIVDHGEGIPPQIREKIFQRFWRADSSRARETGGSGLGLAIVSGIIASHKGTVEVLETPGGGATFRITLPLLPKGYRPPAPAA